ncbi:MAG: TetR family transcriptional regulator [Actinomycetota bacterium]
MVNSSPSEPPETGADVRRPVGRPPRFDRDTIVAAGVELLAERGVDGFGVRRLADALDTTAATISRHLGGQDQLLAAVLDAVIGQIEIPPPPGSAESEHLRAWLIAATDAFRAQMLRYPGVADQLLLSGPTGPAGLAAMGRMCDVLALTGRAPDEVARAYDWLMTTVSAYTGKEDRLKRQGGAARVAEILADRAAEYVTDEHFLAVLADFTGDMGAAYERTTQAVIDAIVAPGNPQP